MDDQGVRKFEMRFCPHCSGPLDDPFTVAWGGWEFDERRNILTAPKVVQFTHIEGVVIAAILRRHGRVAHKTDHLYAAICGNRPDADWPEIKIVDVVVCKVRKKLFKADVFMIERAWGQGYYAAVYDPERRPPPMRERPIIQVDRAPSKKSVCECGHVGQNHHIVGKRRTFCRRCKCEKFKHKEKQNESANGV